MKPQMRFPWLGILLGAALWALIILAARPLVGQSPGGEVAWLRSNSRLEQVPPEWHAWWDWVARRCRCQPATDFESVRMFVFETDATPLGAGAEQLYGGFVAIGRRWMHNELIVKHELLHVMLGSGRANDHSPIFRALGLDTEWITRTLAGTPIR